MVPSACDDEGHSRRSKRTEQRWLTVSHVTVPAAAASRTKEEEEQ